MRYVGGFPIAEQEAKSLVAVASAEAGAGTEEEDEEEEGTETLNHLTESPPMAGTSVPAKHDRPAIFL